MLDKQKRLLEVYEYSRAKLGIHTQTDFANAISGSRAVVSSALNGNPQYLTNKFFRKICASFPGVFNYEYLQTGTGTLLLDTAVSYEPVVNPTKESQELDLVKSLLASKNETIEALRQEIKTKDQYIELLKSEYNKLKQSTSRYDHILSDGPLIASEPFPDKD